MGVDGGRGGSVRVSVGGGPGPLLMRPVADGKKLFLWREVLEGRQVAADHLLNPLFVQGFLPHKFRLPGLL